MAHHATPTLSFRLPLPSFAVVETDDIGHATGVIRSGGCVHVSTRELAAQVLTALGPGGNHPGTADPRAQANIWPATRTPRTMSSIFLSVSIMT